MSELQVLIYVFFSGVGLSPLSTAATSGLLYKPQMIDEGDCGAIGGMKIVLIYVALLVIIENADKRCHIWGTTCTL
jgi:hypothetical protein